MKNLSAIAPILTLCTLIAACDTRREIFSDAAVWVPLEVRWREAGVKPEGVSIYVFAQETGRRVELRLTNDVSSDSLTLDSLSLHVGKYSLLVMNETVASHDNASFRGVDRHLEFEAYIRTVAPENDGMERIALPVQYDPVASQNVLAAAAKSDLAISYDMLSGKREKPALILKPAKISFVVDVTLHVKNLRYLHDSDPVAAVTNMAEGAFLATKAANGVPITQYFTLHGRSLYPGSATDGTLTGTFVAFGVANAAEKNILLMPFRLHDGAYFPLERDVTGMIQEGSVVNGHVEITLGTGTAGDPPIEITQVPVDDASGLFEVEVDEWGQNTDVDVPVG
jgi:hypothetical protein